MQTLKANGEWLTANSDLSKALSPEASSQKPVAGIYIHIPFCKQACSYCNFHFSTSLANKDALLIALHEELRLRLDYLAGADIESIYFGGGTPSLLSAKEIENLLEAISSLYTVTSNAEITLEANPDDLTSDKVWELKGTLVNRLSIGIQSFYDDELKYMNRAHTAKEGFAALERAKNAGFRSLTMDLIYGTPLLTEQRWIESLQRVADFGIPHLSAYQLTIEPKTVLAHQINKGISPAPNDEATVRQFEMLMDWAIDFEYEHYEISNLAKPGHRAVHNSNYWKGIPYLGIGPSAHSFNGREREWNIANNALYINGIAKGNARQGIETLTEKELYNEYMMTGLRTVEGVEIVKLSRYALHFQEHFMESVIPYLTQGKVRFTGGSWILTRTGKFLADRIASELFVV
ncbi:MAG TPA: radical SAM family heme chaperone HemW [Saprospiraceae bacterium]|nr:radical SAM family heme chaperone HemW [Saprospiraceae bacterium]